MVLPYFSKKIIMCILMLISFSASLVFSQSKELETGYPFIKNYNPKEYKAHGQNFGIIQDKRGVLYFANFTGVLEYDGAAWRTIYLRNNSKASSLAMDEKGRVYVGGRGEFGYLKPEPSGKMIYNSISSSNKLKGLLDVTSTFVTNQGVYFISENQIFLWKNNKLKYWNSDKKIISSFFIDKLYCFRKNEGLMIFDHGTFTSVDGTKEIPPAIEILMMLKLTENKFLLGSETGGLYILNGNKLQKFSTEADKYLSTNKLSNGILLSNGLILIGTNRGGAVVLTTEGRVLKIFNENVGLPNQNIKNIFVDRDKTLWLATDNGISELEYPSPLTYFNEKSGLKGEIFDIVRNNSRIYFAAYSGLHFLDPQNSRFIPVNGISTACWSLLNFNNTLLVAASDGVYEVNNNSAKRITEGFTLKLSGSRKYASRVYAGQTSGIKILNYVNGRWTSEAYSDLNEEVINLTEDNSGALWAETSFKGILKIDNNRKRYYDTTSGLPSVLGNHLNTNSGGLFITTQRGIYQYDVKEDKFRASKHLKGIADSLWLSKLIQDSYGNFWINKGDETNPSLLKYYNGSYILENTALLPVSEFVTRTILPEKDGTVWLGGPDGVIRYDKIKSGSYNSGFKALIRRVTLNDDEVVFHGTYYDDNFLPSLQQNNSMIQSFNFNTNSIRFEYSAASYSTKGGTDYQVILEGFDKDWSPWSNSYQKEYTNLSDGNYTFKVKSRNLYGEVSAVSSYAFSIMTPWYKSWWAYPFYLILFGGLIFGLVKLRSGKLEKEKKVLAGIIEERTSEVVKQKAEIENKSLELADKNDELEKINLIVKSINSEINFSSMLQSILNRILVIRGIERALVLVVKENTQQYECKAGFELDTEAMKDVSISLDDVEEYYLKDSEELFEDIFIKNRFSSNGYTGFMGMQQKPASAVLLMVKVDDKAEGFLILENMSERDAFTAKDISFLKSLKEHIISAFIKTRIMDNLQLTLNNLKEAQAQLVQSEKLASLGQLTAGIAHEIKNPLNFVNNFAVLSVDLVKELKEEILKEKDKLGEKTVDYINEILTDLEGNASKINEHGKRADSIVRGMLLHSRGKSGEMQKASINSLLDEYVNLAYHGFRAQESSFNIKLTKCYDDSIEMINVVPQDLSRVFLNLLNNACYSTHEKKKSTKDKYDPELTILTKNHPDKIEIRIRDNGKGIPKEVLEKIFNPFFTTKPAGKGTGLGLSISFDIITQQHKGDIRVDSEEGEFAEFTITIPKNLK